MSHHCQEHIEKESRLTGYLSQIATEQMFSNTSKIIFKAIMELVRHQAPGKFPGIHKGDPSKESKQ